MARGWSTSRARCGRPPRRGCSGASGMAELGSPDLLAIARRSMVEHGLEPDFPAEALAELARIEGPARGDEGGVRDLPGLLWCSIDNDDSRDLDQLTVAEPLAGGAVKGVGAGG